jgi:hypothetical protein
MIAHDFRPPPQGENAGKSCRTFRTIKVLLKGKQKGKRLIAILFVSTPIPLLTKHRSLRYSFNSTN